jgi:hypothetical protein
LEIFPTFNPIFGVEAMEILYILNAAMETALLRNRSESCLYNFARIVEIESRGVKPGYKCATIEPIP